VSWEIAYTTSAAKAIRKLDPPVRRQVKAAVERLADDPTRGKPLQLTLQGLRSWRTGEWRGVDRADNDRVVVLVIAGGHRRDVYDRSAIACDERRRLAANQEVPGGSGGGARGFGSGR
jgi:mRNA interferase RelE/StbE